LCSTSYWACRRFSTSWAFALLALHDLVNAAWRTVLAVIVEAMSELPLLTFAVTLVDVAAGVATTPVLVEVGA
jgi:xanthine/uracil/vitamin C permease (AzgA family)